MMRSESLTSQTSRKNYKRSYVLVIERFCSQAPLFNVGSAQHFHGADIHPIMYASNNMMKQCTSMIVPTSATQAMTMAH